MSSVREAMVEAVERKAAWYARHDCSHAHCPLDCEHPQPFLDGDILLCGRCWFIEGRQTEMVACTPDVCE